MELFMEAIGDTDPIIKATVYSQPQCWRWRQDASDKSATNSKRTIVSVLMNGARPVKDSRKNSRTMSIWYGNAIGLKSVWCSWYNRRTWLQGRKKRWWGRCRYGCWLGNSEPTNRFGISYLDWITVLGAFPLFCLVRMHLSKYHRPSLVAWVFAQMTQTIQVSFRLSTYPKILRYIHSLSLRRKVSFTLMLDRLPWVL